MKIRLLLPVAVLGFGLIATAAARSYDASTLPYSDPPADLPTAVALSVLTETGILRGNPDRSFRGSSPLNRAEFTQIAMRVYDQHNPGLSVPDGLGDGKCFPDVEAGVWYAMAVCRAKAYGIVQGNQRRGLSSDRWPFEPGRYVQYEEAVKMLVSLYGVATAAPGPRDDWYDPYLDAAVRRNLALPELRPGDKMTRGGMARLVANFFAWSEGELDALHAAQEGTAGTSSVPTTSGPQRSSSSSAQWTVQPAASSVSSSAKSVPRDSRADTAVLSNILYLGETSPAIAGVRFFSTSEPISADSVTIQLTGDVPTVETMLVYDETQRFLGIASAEPNTLGRYILRVARGMLTLPHKQSFSIYVRARLKSWEYGGESAQVVQVSSVDINGTGDWSNTEYVQSSTETFPGFETARGAPILIRNAGSVDSVIAAGTSQLLAEFRAEGRETDSEADVRLTTMRFTIESAGGIAVTNARLRVDGSDSPHDCTVSSPVITCSAIPAAIGSLDSPRVLRVYGDVAVPAGTTNAFLRITLNDPGTIEASGDVTWTDGSATFTWLPLTQPVARGTMFR